MISALPLSGLKVVEIGHSVAAPFGALILAELGADVTKIENPRAGDDARSWGPPFVEGSSALFKTLNRNKYSAALDLKDPEALRTLREFIIDSADVVIQNMRPGTIDRYGLDAKSLRALKPSLIYCNLGAFGAEGPLARHPGYDPLMQAFSGIMSVTGEEGRPPVRVSPSIVDQGTGMWAAIGILAALYRRLLTGDGAEVDTCLFETAVAWVAPHIANYLASGQVPRRLGTENPGIAPYRAFETADGWLVIAAGNDALFERLVRALEAPQLLSDPRFSSNPKRVENREELNARIAEIIARKPRAAWTEELDAVGVPCAPMQTIAELLAHPQMIASGILQAPPEGNFPVVGLPLRFDSERPPYRRQPPALGADTEGIRSRLQSISAHKDQVAE
jgi:crotonobetainyl-CoA:carnitine CoA-transferase CaiB-like acyl-CoA transferase